MSERDDLEDLIEALSPERRGALLLELAERYDVVRARLERERPGRNSLKALATQLRRALASWKRRRGMPDYRASRDLAGELDEWLASVDREILPRSPALALVLAQDLLEADQALLESIDDSNGEVGARLREACLVWLRAAKATGDESDDWIDRIHALYTRDDYGTREPLLGHANLLLTERQLRALADRFQAEMQAVLGQRRAGESLPFRIYHLGAAIGLVADALRDPELRARSILMYSPEPNSLQRAGLAEACLEYGRPEVALTWLWRLVRSRTRAAAASRSSLQRARRSREARRDPAPVVRGHWLPRRRARLARRSCRSPSAGKRRDTRASA